MTLTYLYDPLCGWCYGAAPAVRALLVAGKSVALLPSGLFAVAGRTMDAGFADYVWNADQRIGKLTGQEFSERYRSEVLGRAGAAFDSGPATRALTAVHLGEPNREAEALGAIQRARWVEGRDICDPDVLGDIVAALGLPAEAALARSPDQALIEATDLRVAHARALMRRLGLHGVPALLPKAERALNNALLFGPRDALLAAV